MRVPSNRAGMSARCPGCKAVVVIPFPPSDYNPSELLEAVRASSAIAPTKQDEPPAETSDPVSDAVAKPETSEMQIEHKEHVASEKMDAADDTPVKTEKVKPKLEVPPVEKTEPKELPKPGSSEKQDPGRKVVSKKSSPPTGKSAGTSERKRKRKRKSTSEAPRQKSSPKLDLAASSNPSEKVRPRDNKPKAEPQKPKAESPKQNVDSPKPKAEVPKAKVDAPKQVSDPIESKTHNLGKASKTSPLDGVFSAFTSDIPGKETGKPDPAPKAETDTSTKPESVDPVSVPTFSSAKPVSELPTIDPVNRVGDSGPVQSRVSSHDPGVFQFDEKSTLGVAFEPENQSSNGVSAIEIRTRRANADRVTLTRFFAAMLVFVGLVNFAPAIYCWYTWSQVDIDFLLPRWIYLQIFIAVLHLVYAVLLLQVPDWSTLRSIAVVMLAFAFVFGLFSMGLLTTGGNGLLAQFLQVPDSLGRQACIWCVAMLCLATLASYLAGRESNNWQRTERLLAEILANKEAS